MSKGVLGVGVRGWVWVWVWVCGCGWVGVELRSARDMVFSTLSGGVFGNP